MVDLDKIWVEHLVKTSINDFAEWGIKSFGDWLKHYDDTFDEVLQIVNDYCDKVVLKNTEPIQQWEQAVMLNALALYVVEMDTNEIPTGVLRDNILKVFVETIRMYKYKKLGFLKINGEIYISNIAKNCFVEA